MKNSPEIGNQIKIGAVNTNYHDIGEGRPVFFIHGSGPGVTAWANWQLNLAPIAERGLRCVAPDMMGFGYTDAPEGLHFSKDDWVDHFAAFVDSQTSERIAIVGNSFGGAVALAYAIRFPERVDRMVLMGAAGLNFPITDELDEIWGHIPTLENMVNMMKIFAYNPALVKKDLAELRHNASMRPGVMEAYSAMFPEPRQEAVRALASDEGAVAKVEASTLIIHGHDDRVIPVDVSKRLFELLPNSEIHMFRNCGHWTQIEKNSRFNALVGEFLSSSED